MKLITKLILLKFIFLFNSLFAQIIVNDTTFEPNNHVGFSTEILETILNESKPIKKIVIIKVYEGEHFDFTSDSSNVLIQELNVNSGPILDIYIPRNKKYLIEFTCEGDYIKKRIMFNSFNVPAEKEFPSLSIRAITLFKKVPGIDYSIFNIPIVQTWYNREKEKFDYDLNYVNAILTAYDLFNDLSKKHLKIQEQEKAKIDQIFRSEKLKSKNTIIIITGLSFLVILTIIIFFIVRISYNRKKTNISLEEKNFLIESQKHTVEEKQKEILDSIKYAKRIQSAHMPTEKYIGKNIDRLKDKS